MKLLPYLAVVVLTMYGLPLIIQDTGSAMFVLLAAIPAVCFLTGAALGRRHGFQLGYPLAVALLFLPTIFLFYNGSAAVYLGIFSLVALVGNLLGWAILFIHARKNR